MTAAQALARLKSEVRFILNSFVEQGPEEDESWESYFDAVVSGEASDLICAEIDRAAAELGCGSLSPQPKAVSVSDQAEDAGMVEAALKAWFHPMLPPDDESYAASMHAALHAAFRARAEQREAPSVVVGEELRQALEPFLVFARLPSFAKLPDDYRMTPGSPMAAPQLTVGQFKALLAAAPTSDGR